MSINLKKKTFYFFQLIKYASLYFDMSNKTIYIYAIVLQNIPIPTTYSIEKYEKGNPKKTLSFLSLVF